MRIDEKAWGEAIARVRDTVEAKLYLGDVYPFEEYGLPEFMTDPTRKYAVLSVVEEGASPNEIIERNRQIIQAVAALGLRAYQLVIERDGSEGAALEPAVIALSPDDSIDLEAVLTDYERLDRPGSGVIRVMGLTRPQNSISGLLFKALRLSS